jgi:hypothetical protein
MPTPQQLKRLATRPDEYMRFVTTGRLPRGIKPQGPLVELLSAVTPRDRLLLRGVRIDARLGYVGAVDFANAAHAWNWLAPSREVFGSFPAESRRDKRFTQQLFIEDLLECCSNFPEGFAQRYPRLRRPRPPGE